MRKALIAGTEEWTFLVRAKPKFHSFLPSFLLAGDETGIVGLSAEGGGGEGKGERHFDDRPMRPRPSIRSVGHR